MNIMVVDDEKPIRQWFTFCIERSGEDYRVVGDAANGQAALELFERLRPDVVITDIKMPVMDGLELTRRIKNLEPTTSVIILTSHAEFEFAREALQLEADEYMLKFEVQDRDVLHMLGAVREKRSARQTGRREEQVKREAFLCRLLEDGEAARPSAEQLLEYGIAVQDRNVFAVAIHVREAAGAAVAKLERVIAEQCGEFIGSSHVFRLSESRIVWIGSLLVQTSSQLYMMVQLRQLLNIVQRSVHGRVGVSRMYASFADLRECCLEALAALDKVFFTGATRRDDDPDSIARRIRPLYTAIDDKSHAAIMAETEKLLNWLADGAVPEVVRLYAICLDIIELLLSKIKLHGLDAGIDSLALVNAMYATAHFDELRALFARQVAELADALCQPRTYSAAVGRAIRYIHEQFMNDLPLQRIADHVHLNASYLSHRFKKETSWNISEYVAHVRLKRAEQLLKYSDLRAYEVCEQVGYRNFSHFSRVFKEYSGISPQELIKQRKTK